MKTDKYEKKLEQDRKDYETLCRLSDTFPMLAVLDWYWHFNQLKNKLKKP